jgi:hypothetical protein
MEYYHGTTVGGLEILQPFANPASNLKKPCVYLSTIREIAAMYIWKHPFKWLTFEFGQHNEVIYYECFPGHLEYFYRGVTGYIYAVEGEFECDNKIGIRCAAISEQPITVQQCETIPDACETLLNYERQGNLMIHRFETLSPEKHAASRRMVLSAIKRLDLLKEDKPMAAFVKEKFPEIWNDALHHDGVSVRNIT